MEVGGSAVVPDCHTLLINTGINSFIGTFLNTTVSPPSVVTRILLSLVDDIISAPGLG